MKFFRVKAKCGHVGMNKYFEGTFYIEAESKKEAAKKTRDIGRVKHDRKDAILEVEEIDIEAYIKGINEKAKNPYYNCKNRQEQNLYLHEIQDSIVDENIEEKHKKTKRHSLRKTHNHDIEYDLIRSKKLDVFNK